MRVKASRMKTGRMSNVLQTLNQVFSIYFKMPFQIQKKLFQSTFRNPDRKTFRAVFGSIILIAGMMSSISSQAVTIKIATLSPEGSSWVNAMRKAAADVKAATEGRVKFKFYPGGVMGDDKAVLRKIRIGQLQGAAMTASQISQKNTNNQIYNLPMVFQNYEEVDHVRKSLDPILMTGFKDVGFTTFGIVEVGFAYMLSKHPIDSVESLRKSKVWIPSNDVASEKIAKTFDINPIPLPLSDVLTGLQTSLVDTVGTSPIGALALQWHTQLKYMIDMPVMFIYGVIGIDNKTYNRLSKQDQGVVTEAFTKASQHINQQARSDNLSAFEALKNQGIQVVPFSEKEKALALELSQASWQQLVDSGIIGKELFDQLSQSLSEIRSKP